MKTPKVLLAMIAVFAVGLSAAHSDAAERPNFSGVWMLRPEQSDFGKSYPAPRSNTNVVEQTEAALTLTVLEVAADGSEKRGVVRYLLDGTETTNDVLGNPMKATAVWQGEALLIKTWGEFNGNSIKLDDRWALSPDGRTLNVTRHFSGAGGLQADQRIVYARVSAPVKNTGVPAGFHTITPELMVRDGARAVEFYQRAFAAEEKSRVPAKDGKRDAFARMQIGDAAFLVSEEAPSQKRPASSVDGKAPDSGSIHLTIHLYTADVEAAFKRAVAAGAKVELPLQETSWGDRYGSLRIQVVSPICSGFAESVK